MSELLMISPCLEVTLLFAKLPLEITTCVTIILNSEPCFWFNIQYLLDQSLKIDHLFCNLVKPVWAWCYNKELSSVEISIEYLNHAANALRRTIPRKLNTLSLLIAIATSPTSLLTTHLIKRTKLRYATNQTKTHPHYQNSPRIFSYQRSNSIKKTKSMQCQFRTLIFSKKLQFNWMSKNKFFLTVTNNTKVFSKIHNQFY